MMNALGASHAIHSACKKMVNKFNSKLFAEAHQVTYAKSGQEWAMGGFLNGGTNPETGEYDKGMYARKAELKGKCVNKAGKIRQAFGRLEDIKNELSSVRSLETLLATSDKGFELYNDVQNDLSTVFNGEDGQITKCNLVAKKVQGLEDYIAQTGSAVQQGQGNGNGQQQAAATGTGVPRSIMNSFANTNRGGSSTGSLHR
ncbi:MAG: hypothetical protein HY537_17350 [Deltaproteobacteria bacterium]|nr:hypothetical protein [Deltaproteobacteria bacterium]